MSTNNINSKKGFTIIEVVLVLAVAGLIFMMVFLALPAMQRAQKDTQRRDQLSGLVTQITQYQANNRNKIPDSATSNNTKASNGATVDKKGWLDFYNNYLLAGGDVFDDPNGNVYNLTISTCAKNSTCKQPNSSFDAQGYTINIVTNSHCDGEQVVYDSGDRKVTVSYKLEGGGVFCQGN